MQILFTVLSLLVSAQSYGAVCSRTLSFVDGAVLNASQLNGEFNAITNCANSLTDDNIATSANILPQKINSTIAGDGLARDGASGVLSVGVDGVTMEITSDMINVKDGGISAAKIGSDALSSDGFLNIGLSASVSANILTIALKQSDGSTDPSATVPSKIGFRSSTATSGGYAIRSVTSALSLAITNGSTLGTVSGVPTYLYVYAVDNGGTIVLAVSGNNYFQDGSIRDTTAEGGAGAADDGFTLYAASTLSSKSIRLIGRILISEVTAGAWASSPTEVTVSPFPKNKFWMVSATIDGTNPDLGTSAVSSYTGITNTALTLTNNTGPSIIPAKITCSSTNAPSGTTCSSGSEELGVSFTIPDPGTVMACAQFNHISRNASNGATSTSFQIVETPNSAQTITQSGVDTSRDQGSVNSGTLLMTIPHRLCSVIPFSTSGQKSIRLFYKQEVNATQSSLIIFGQDPIFLQGPSSPMSWTIYPIN